MGKDQFPRDEALTAVTISYSNPDQAMIADRILPRSKVGKEDFSWVSYPKGQAFTVPRTKIGDKGRAPRLEFTGSKQSSSTEDNALELPITQKRIDNAPANADPKKMLTMLATKLLLLRREIDVAEAVQDATQYAASNVINLNAGADKTEFLANPLKYLRKKFNAMLMRPNVIALGQDLAELIRTHTVVVSAALGNDGTNGVAPLDRLAELLDVQEILVGAGRVNVAKPGQVPDIQQIWTQQMVAFYRDSTASFDTDPVTFGLTAQVGDRVAATKTIEIGEMGIKGGQVVLVGESTKPLIIAPDCGMLFQNGVTALS